MIQEVKMALVFAFPKLLSVICNAKNSFMETVNCQTVTLGTDDTDSLWGWH